MKYKLNKITKCPKCNGKTVTWSNNIFEFIGIFFKSIWNECNSCGFRFCVSKEIIGRSNQKLLKGG